VHVYVIAFDLLHSSTVTTMKLRVYGSYDHAYLWVFISLWSWNLFKKPIQS